jgi:DNA-binding Xre family transcriptional regulator
MARVVIKEVAKQRGINQSQLQIKSGVTPPLLNRYWNNNTQSVALEPLEKIAKALDVKMGDLIMSDAEYRATYGHQQSEDDAA